jgi:hypothetical protein
MISLPWVKAQNVDRAALENARISRDFAAGFLRICHPMWVWQVISVGRLDNLEKCPDFVENTATPALHAFPLHSLITVKDKYRDEPSELSKLATFNFR